MPVIPPKGEAGRWEGIRTLAVVTSAAVALLVGTAAAVSFIVSHFATTHDIDGLKEVQNRLVTCIERFAVPLHDIQVLQLQYYASYVNDKANFIAKTETADGNKESEVANENGTNGESGNGGKSAREYWWLRDVKDPRGMKELKADEIRTNADKNFGAVLALDAVVKDLHDTFDKHCDELKLERGKWDVSP